MKQTSLVYGDTYISNRCQTLAYIEEGLPGECWQKNFNKNDCCCIDAGYIDPGNDAPAFPTLDCDDCETVSELIHTNGVYPLDGGGTATVTNLTASPFTGSPQAGCGDALDPGPWGIVGSSGFGSFPAFTINFSQPVSGIRLYVGNVNPEEELTLSAGPADCVSPDADCDGITFTPTGFVADATHTISSHIVEYAWQNPISTLTLTHNQLGLGHLVRFEVLDCIIDPFEPAVFVDPATDEAPWYDPSNACSEEFFGFITNSVKIGNPFKRKIKDTINGGFIQTRNLNAREIVIRGWIVSSSECGTQYGIDWLQTSFDPDNCNKGNCKLPDLALSVCCDSEDPTKGTRVLRQVAPVTGVKDLDPDSDYRCCRAEVEIKLAAQDPHFWSEKKTLASGITIEDDPIPNWCCANCDDDIIWPDCAIDAVEQTVTTSTQQGDCYCAPIFANKACALIEPGTQTLTQHIDWTLTNATGTDLVNLSLEFLEEPDGATGDPITNPEEYSCTTAQASTTISFLPDGHTLTLDSTTSDLIMQDPAGEVVSVYGVGGGGRITLGCNPGYLCLTSDTCNETAGLTLEICSRVGVL